MTSREELSLGPGKNDDHWQHTATREAAIRQAQHTSYQGCPSAPLDELVLRQEAVSRHGPTVLTLTEDV